MFKACSIAALSTLILSSFANANWQLNNELSQINYLTIKNTNTAENNYFQKLTGSLTDEGLFRVEIDLDSVNTLIPIRDERMKKIVFETDSFSTATLTANLKEFIPSITQEGVKIIKNIKAELDFHGAKKEITLEAFVNVSPNGTITVSSLAPIIINAADFSVDKGVKQLQEIAQLPSISIIVPVSFALTLVKESA